MMIRYTHGSIRRGIRERPRPRHRDRPAIDARVPRRRILHSQSRPERRMFAVTATSTAALSARVNVSVDARRPGKATARGAGFDASRVRVRFSVRSSASRERGAVGVDDVRPERARCGARMTTMTRGCGKREGGEGWNNFHRAGIRGGMGSSARRRRWREGAVARDGVSRPNPETLVLMTRVRERGRA